MQQVRLIPCCSSWGSTARSVLPPSAPSSGAWPHPARTRYLSLLQQRSALGELLEVDYESMSMMQLYRASDLLGAAQKEIESHLFNRVTDLFGLEVTVTLYDLSNTYFEGEAAAQPWPSAVIRRRSAAIVRC